MASKLELYIPNYEDLWFRQKIMSDEKTMSYNKGYDLEFEGYHKETGFINFPEKNWKEWYTSSIGKEPRLFYAYI